MKPCPRVPCNFVFRVAGRALWSVFWILHRCMLPPDEIAFLCRFPWGSILWRAYVFVCARVFMYVCVCSIYLSVVMCASAALCKRNSYFGPRRICFTVLGAWRDAAPTGSMPCSAAIVSEGTRCRRFSVSLHSSVYRPWPWRKGARDATTTPAALAFEPANAARENQSVTDTARPPAYRRPHRNISWIDSAVRESSARY